MTVDFTTNTHVDTRNRDTVCCSAPYASVRTDCRVDSYALERLLSYGGSKPTATHSLSHIRDSGVATALLAPTPFHTEAPSATPFWRSSSGWSGWPTELSPTPVEPTEVPTTSVEPTQRPTTSVEPTELPTTSDQPTELSMTSVKSTDLTTTTVEPTESMETSTATSPPASNTSTVTEATTEPVFPAQPPVTPFPVVRVFGTATNESQPLPADGVCDYTFYDGLYDTGPFDTLYSPHFSAPVEHVLSHASLHSVTEYGLSFAYRNASQVARDLEIPEATHGVKEL
ncbi:hypothetical protein MRX96_049534 [Rhipicephalus microplus]